MKRDSKQLKLIAVTAFAAVLLITILLWLGGSIAVHKARLASAESDLAVIRASLTAYSLEYGGFPTGTTSNILDELMGKNAKGIVFLTLPLSSSPTRFIDPWGEPYILIPASGLRVPEFYSKGPDRIDNSCAPSSDDILLGKP